jgi:Zinc finger, C2H2 type
MKNFFDFICFPSSDCETCNFKAKSSKLLREHVKQIHHALCLRCDICSYEASSKDEIECHIQKDHMKKEQACLYCEFCSKEFDKRHLLNRHIKLKHTEKQRTHPCPTCEKSFFTISTLKKHVESHRTKNMPCEFCGKLFSCMNNLRTHLYYHAEPKFKCEFADCGKKFFMRKLLKAHLNVKFVFFTRKDSSKFTFSSNRFIVVKRTFSVATVKRVISSNPTLNDTSCQLI